MRQKTRTDTSRGEDADMSDGGATTYRDESFGYEDEPTTTKPSCQATVDDDDDDDDYNNKEEEEPTARETAYQAHIEDDKEEVTTAKAAR